jgi:hypothetical protein
MNVPLRRPMTVDAFMAWEGEQKERWEFDGFQPGAGRRFGRGLVGDQGRACGPSAL